MKNILTKNFSGFIFLRAALIVFSVCSAFATALAQNNLPPRQNGNVIVYNSIPAPQLYSVKTDGSNRTQLTFACCQFRNDRDQPYFSWDGGKIYFTAFTDDDPGRGEIYRINADGSNETRISNNGTGNPGPGHRDQKPAVSPDGSKIVFECDQSGPVTTTCVANANGYTGDGSLRLNASYTAFRPSYSPDGSKVVFYGKPYPCSGCNYYNVYVMNADGTNATALTNSNNNTEFNVYPRFSPDGTKIVFVRSAEGDVNNSSTSEIWVMNANGSNQTRLTTTGANIEPSWSPDGTKIVYVNHSLQPAYEAYYMDANGANTTRVTFGGANSFGEEVHNPTWSVSQTNTPQHQNGKIAYATGDTYSNIYTVNPDGTNNANISSFPNGAATGQTRDDQPYFSWDGTKIYFRSYRDDTYGETYVMGANGGSVTRLSYNSGYDYPFNPCPLDASPAVSPDGSKVIFNAYGNNASVMREMSASGYSNATNNCNGQPPMILPEYSAFTPSYSPDGTKIIFDGKLRSVSYFYRDVYVLDRNNSTVTRLTFGDSTNDQYVSARFSPDGSKIVCQHNVNVNGNVTSDIVVLNADGSNRIDLTNTGNSSMPFWSPDGTKIVFRKIDQTYKLYTMDANGANQTLVLSSSANDFLTPTWGASPYVSVTPASNVNLQFSNVTSGGNTTATPISPSSPPSGYTFPANAPAYDITTTASYSGTIDVILQVPNVTSAANCSNLRILHFTGGAWTDAGNAAPQYDSGTSICTLRQTVTSLSPFAVAQVAGPTAASVFLGGRVLNGKRGIRNVLVTLTEANGASRTVLTGASGSYRFENISVGQTVIISVRAKNYYFSQPTQVLNLTEDFDEMNFYSGVNLFRLNSDW